MPRVGFEPTISAGEWPKTYTLDRAATGTGVCIIRKENYDIFMWFIRNTSAKYLLDGL